mmetsp:Transcript_16337/g.53486  ORF Transcript_16337/g.53486 Transcript_16337/m.53486 type:complete len:200 (+) Transcript_16337:569-1168(+)
MACGDGRSYFCRLSYRPVPGDRKSGMPADTEMPAPQRTTTDRGGQEASRCAKPAMSKDGSCAGRAGASRISYPLASSASRSCATIAACRSSDSSPLPSPLPSSPLPSPSPSPSSPPSSPPSSKPPKSAVPSPGIGDAGRSKMPSPSASGNIAAAAKTSSSPSSPIAEATDIASVSESECCMCMYTLGCGAAGGARGLFS